MKKINVFLAMILLAVSTFAQTALPIACYFDDANYTLPAGWSFIIADESPNNYNVEMAGIVPLAQFGSVVSAYSSPNSFCFASGMSFVSDFNQYLISPRIFNSTTDSVQLRLMYAAEDCYGNVESFRIGYCAADEYDLAQVVWYTSDIQTSSTSWQALSVNLPADAQYVVINYDVQEMQCALYIDNVLIRADVEGISYPVTVNANAGGAVIPGTTAVPEADNFTFTATADPGHYIESVLLDGSPLAGAAGATTFHYTIPYVMAPHQVDVTFAIREYSIYVTEGQHGSVDPNGGETHNVIVPWGADTTFRFYPDEGYHVNDVVVDMGWHGGPISEYTFHNVTANHRINVDFALNHYIITASAGPNGTISPAGNVDVASGSNSLFIITPNTGYLIDTLYIDGEVYPGVPNTGYIYTFHNVVADHTIHAVFTPEHYLVVGLPAIGGTVTLDGGTPISADSTMVPFGQTVTANFTADEGYILRGVNVNGEAVTPYSSQMTLTISGPTTIQPVFGEQTYSVIVSRQGTGWVTPMNANDISYFEESVFEISPNHCAQIDSILLDGEHLPITTELHLSHLIGRHYLSVYFSNIMHTMTLAEVEHGTITTTTPQVTCGAPVQFNLNADPCYEATHFYVDGVQHDELMMTVSGNRIARLTNIEAPHVISADFEMAHYQIVANKTGNGSISHEGTTTVTCGDNMEFVIAPEECYQISSIRLNNADFVDVTWHPASLPGFADTAIFSLDDISQDYNIDVTFAQTTYALTTSAVGRGTVTPNGANIVNCGTEHNVTITPDACYQIDKVYVDNELVTDGLVVDGDAASYTFSDVRADHELRAEFVIKEYTMHIETAGNGTASPLGGSIVQCGSNFRFEAMPNQCQRVDSVYIDGVLSNELMTFYPNADSLFGDTLSYIFNNLTASHNIRIVFAPIQYAYTIGTIGEGTVTSNVTGETVLCGDNIQLTLTPGDCNHIRSIYYNGNVFSDCQIDENGIGRINLQNIGNDVNLAIVFSPITYSTIVTQPQHGQIQYQPVDWSCGQDVTFETSVGACYHIDTLFVNGQAILPSEMTIVNENYQYTVADVREDLSVHAAISIDSVQVVSNAGVALSFSDTTLACASPLQVTTAWNDCMQLDSIIWNGNLYEDGTLGDFGTISHTSDTLSIHIYSVIENSSLAVYTSDIQYNLSVRTNGLGEVSFLGDQQFTCGDSIALHITPNACHELSFVTLNNELVTLDNDTLFIINSLEDNLNLYFAFSPIHYLVESEKNGPGEIGGQTGELTCGSLLTYDFIPNDCAQLDSVLVDGQRVETQMDSARGISQYVISELTEPHSITAFFSQIVYEITAITDEHATINVAPLTEVTCGSDFEYAITVDACYSIDEILLDGIRFEALNGRIPDVRDNHELIVTTKRDSLNVRMRIYQESLLAESNQTTVACGSDTTILFNIPDCWHVEGVNINGVRVEIQDSCHLTNVTEDMLIDVHLQYTSYTVEYQIVDHCILDEEPIQLIPCEGDYLVQAHAEDGYTITGWIINGDTVSNQSYLISNIRENYEVTPIVTLNTYLIQTFVEEGHGSVYPESPIVNYGDDMTIYFLPDTCQRVDLVHIDGAFHSGITSYTFHNVREDHLVRVDFAQSVDTIFVNATAHGAVTGNGEILSSFYTVRCGDDCQLSFKPDPCYDLGFVFVDNVLSNSALTRVGNAYILPLSSIDTNHNVRVTFEPIRYNFTATSNYGGTVSPMIASPMCGTDYTFHIEALDCYEIDSVWIDGVYRSLDNFRVEDNVYSYTFFDLQEDHRVNVRFKGQVFQFDIDNDGESQVLVEQIGNDCAGDIHFTIVPDICENIDRVFVNDLDVTRSLIHHPNENPNWPDSLSYTISQITSDHLVSIRTSQVPDRHVHLTFESEGETLLHYDSTIVCNGNLLIPVESDCYLIESIEVNNSRLDLDYPLSETFYYEFRNITGDSTIFAKFIPRTYEISASAGEGGQISPNGETAVLCDDDIVYIITADEGYAVDSVFVNDEYIGSVDTIAFENVRQDNFIRAIFRELHFTVTATASEGGQVSPASSDVIYGQGVTINITPDDCYSIADVLVNGASVGAVSSYTFDNVRGDSSLAVTFAMNTYTITATAGEGGQISPNGATTVNCGDTLGFQITADEGYAIDSVIVNGEMVGTDASYSFENIRENGDIRVVFSQYHFTVTATAGEGGQVSPASSDVIYGQGVTINITPDDCYSIADVLVNGASVGAVSSYTFDNVRGDSSLAVTFAMNTYTITATASDGGQISPNGATTVNCGDTLGFQITADEGYAIDSVIVNGEMVGTDASYSFENIRENGDIRVVLSQYHFTVTATAGEGGQVSPASSDVAYGQGVTINITPDDCYSIADVLVNGASVGAVPSYTFNNVRGDSSLVATFAMNTYTITATAGEGGQISPNGATTENCGDTLGFQIIADEGYAIDSVIVNGEMVGTDASYSFENIRENGDIRVVFSQYHFTVTATAGEGGQVSPASSDVIYGQGVTINITPDDCYSIADVLVNGASVGSVSSYTFDNVRGDSSLAVTFAMNTYTITATAGEGGQISPNGATTVNCGDTLGFQITADEGYAIDSVIVNGEMVGTDASYSFENIRENGDIRVVFSQYHFTVTATAGEGGQVSPASSDVAYGQGVTINITPDDCYSIADVLVNGTSVGSVSSYTFDNVRGDSSLVATFAMNTYTITATAGEGGQISPNGATTVNCGDTLGFQIIADEGYAIDSVIVNGEMVGTDASYSFENIRENGDIRVVFSQYHFTVTATAGEGGQVSPASSDVIYGQGVTINITPDDCYSIADVLVNGASVGAVSSYTFNNVRGDSSLAVTFAMNTYTITATAGEGGQISPNGATTVNCGDTLGFQITADEGYAIDSVIVNGEMVGTDASYSFENIRENGDIRVVFSQYHFTVTATAGEGGQVSPASSGVIYGQGVTINITPDDCYSIADVLVNGASVGAVSSYTFDNVRGDSSLVATFAMNTYTITATAGEGGQISPNGATTVNCGDTLGFQITADEGYAIDSVIVNGEMVGTDASYSFENIRENGDIRVVFSQYHFTVTATAGEGGQVSPASSDVAYGQGVTINITPDDCYSIADVLVNGASVGSVSSYTFNNVRGDSSLVATFIHNSYDVGIVVYLEGQYVLGDSISVPCGSDTLYGISLFTCYSIDSIIINGEYVPVVDTLLISNIHENQSVSIFASRTMYDVVISKQGNGTVTPVDTVSVECDGDLTITMVPDTGWYVSEILIDGISMGTPQDDTYTLTHLHADATVEVIFAVNEYIITSSVEPIDAGQITPYGANIVTYGESVTYYITAFPNYEILDVEVDGVSVGNSSSYTFDFVDDNHRIVAYFEAVGIEDLNGGELRVHAEGKTVVLTNTTSSMVKMMQIFDVQGQQIARFGTVEDGFRTELTVAPGTYFVRVATDKGTESFKVVLY